MVAEAAVRWAAQRLPAAVRASGADGDESTHTILANLRAVPVTERAITVEQIQWMTQRVRALLAAAQRLPPNMSDNSPVILSRVAAAFGVSEAALVRILQNGMPDHLRNGRGPAAAAVPAAAAPRGFQTAAAAAAAAEAAAQAEMDAWEDDP